MLRHLNSLSNGLATKKVYNPQRGESDRLENTGKGYRGISIMAIYLVLKIQISQGFSSAAQAPD